MRKPIAVPKPAALSAAARAGYSASADHAERLLVTDFPAYLAWYSPRGHKAGDVRERPDN